MEKSTEPSADQGALASIRSDHAKLARQLSSSEAALAESKRVADDLRRELLDVRRSKEASVRDLDSVSALHKENQDLSSKLAVKQVELAQFEASVAHLKRQVEDIASQNATLITENTRLSSSLTSVTRDLDQLRERHNSVEAEKDRIKQKSSHAVHDVNALTSRVQTLEIELRTAVDDAKRFEGIARAFQRDIETSKGDRQHRSTNLQADYDNLAELIKTKEAFIGTLREQIYTLKNTEADLRRQLESSRTTSGAASQEARIEELTRELAATREELSKNKRPQNPDAQSYVLPRVAYPPGLSEADHLELYPPARDPLNRQSSQQSSIYDNEWMKSSAQKDLESTVARLTGELEHARVDLTSRDDAILRLKQNVEQLVQQNSALQRELRAANVARSEDVPTMKTSDQQIVALKDQKIRDLKAHLSEKESELNQVTRQLDEVFATVRDKEADILELHTGVSEATKLIQERDATIAALRRDIAGTYSKQDSHASGSAALQHKIDELSAALIEKSNVVKNRETTISILNRDIAQFKVTAQEKTDAANAAAQELKRQAAEFGEKTAEFEKTLAEKNRMLSKMSGDGALRARSSANLFAPKAPTHHTPGIWPNSEQATPVVLHDHSLKAASTCKTGSAALLRALADSDKPLVLDTARTLLGVPRDYAPKLDSGLISAIVAQECFKNFERVSFSSTGTACLHPESEERRRTLFAEYESVNMQYAYAAWDSNVALSKWGSGVLDALVTVLRLPRETLLKELQETFKTIWCLHRIYHAIVVRPEIIYRHFGDPFQMIFCSNRAFDELSEHTDSEGHRGHAAKEHLSTKYDVTYTLFPGFYLDNHPAAPAFVATYLRAR